MCLSIPISTCSSKFVPTWAHLHTSTASPPLDQLETQISQYWHGSGFFPRTSHYSQFSHSMPSPRTHTDSSQISQLEHPSYFSTGNPSLMDENNLQSLHVDTYSLSTPTRGRRKHQESSSSQPLSLASSIPHQCLSTHTCASQFLSTLTIAPSHDPPYFCALMN